MVNRTFNKGQRGDLFTLAGGCCESCGTELGEGFHADHAVAVANGGITDMANARALCPACNRAKGANDAEVRSLDPLPPLAYDIPFKPRRWQVELSNAVESHGDTVFNAFAAPAAGKSVAGVLSYLKVAEGLDRPLLVVLAPRRLIVDGWARTLASFGLTSERASESISYRKRIDDGDLHALISTYHQVALRPGYFRALCQRYDVFVIRDETQWLEESKSWGSNYQDAFEHAAFDLSLTATPVRSIKGERIASYGYDGERALSHFFYSFHDALKDQHIAQIEWTSVDGVIEWRELIDGYELRHAYSFKDELPDRLQNQRLRVAIHADRVTISSYLETMLRLGIAELDAHPIKGVGGIVFAKDIPAAEAILLWLLSEGEQATIVTTEHGNTAEEVERFRNGEGRWIVSVGQMSEGVDVPRIKVAVLAGTSTTYRYVVQALCRANRLVPGAPYFLQSAKIIIPNDERIVAICRDIGRQVEPKNPRPSGTGNGKSSSKPELVYSNADDVHVSDSGVLGYQSRIESLRDRYSGLAKYVDGHEITPLDLEHLEMVWGLLHSGKLSPPLTRRFDYSWWVKEEATKVLRGTSFNDGLKRVVFDVLVRSYSDAANDLAAGLRLGAVDVR